MIRPVVVVPIVFVVRVVTVTVVRIRGGAFVVVAIVRGMGLCASGEHERGGGGNCGKSKNMGQWSFPCG